ncbi:MAG: hypothetical protein H7258_06530 [Ferruginibacter sp.]|nr:hypothetical protein [Ferruginibacter sp.]
MEEAKKIEEQERETLEIVLKEILEEQQKSGKISLDQAAAIDELTIKVNSFNEKLENLKIIAPPVSTKSFEEIFKKVISDRQLTPNSEPKIVTRKFQILLFPEQDAKLFYKIVFSRWLLWLTIMLFITNLYKWSVHWSDNQKEIKLQNSETDRIKKAWGYLYFQEGKSIKRVMDSAYNKSLKTK